jgi:transcriptional regulator with XRE-family HTH domain
MKTLGDRMRELREERDISLREFAKKLGISAAFLSDIELGRRHPSKKVLVRIARELGVKFEDLRQYDTRPTFEDLKRLTQNDPAYGFALRKVIDKKISAQDLLRLAGKHKSKR